MPSEAARHAFTGAARVAASCLRTDARRVLLLGANGRLGAAIAGALSVCETVSLISPTRRELNCDLTSRSWLYGSPSGNLAARLLDPDCAGQAFQFRIDPYRPVVN